MKLTRKDAEKIANHYRLGKVLRFHKIRSGWVNYSFNLTTDMGEYIVQFLGENMNDWLKNKMELEFSVLNYLKSKKFPYQIPVPLKSKNRIHLEKILGIHYWIYKKINGKTGKMINEDRIREIAKALAIYHNYTRNFRIKKKFMNKSIRSWWAEKNLDEMAASNNSKIKQRAIFFRKALKAGESFNFGKNWKIIHGDINSDNVIFNKNKVIGLIDFNNIRYSPGAFDLATAIKNICIIERKIDKKRYNIFIDSYRDYSILTKEEEKLIIPAFIIANCRTYAWFYKGMKKHIDKRDNAMNRIYWQTKMLMEILHK